MTPPFLAPVTLFHRCSGRPNFLSNNGVEIWPRFGLYFFKVPEINNETIGPLRRATHQVVAADILLDALRIPGIVFEQTLRDVNRRCPCTLIIEYETDTQDVGSNHSKVLVGKQRR
jgi:hypothetical protein